MTMTKNQQSNEKSERVELMILSAVSLVIAGLLFDIVLFDGNHVPIWIIPAVFLYVLFCLPGILTGASVYILYVGVMKKERADRALSISCGVGALCSVTLFSIELFVGI